MSLSAQVVAELVAAGLAGQALVDACRRIEAADGATVAFGRRATVAFNRRTNATVARAENATVEPGVGAGKAPLAMIRAAIANTKGLTRGAARVGAAILDRYDGRTGRCEVGIDKISKVCGLHRASVFRAVSALVASGLIRRSSYAGMGHCNAYFPCFEALGIKPEQVAAAGVDATVTVLRPSQGCDPISDKNILPPENNRSIVSRKTRRSEPDRRQGHLPLPIAGGRAMQAEGFKPTPEALRAKAAERLKADLMVQHKGHWLKPVPEAWEAGIEAEIRCHGSGLAAHNAYWDRQLTGTGPP